MAERLLPQMPLPSYQRTTRTLDGLTVNCQTCDNHPNLYRRITLRNAEEIAATPSQCVEPSDDTKVVALSASQGQPYGGSVQLRFAKSDLPARATCYMSRDDPDIRGYEDIRWAKQRENDWSLNRTDAELGISHDMYQAECEFTSKEPVPLPQAQELIYYVHQGRGAISDEFMVGCYRRYPHNIEAGWAGDTWDDQLERINRARAVAEKVGVPFRVDSCFNYVTLRGYRHMVLNQANLDRLTNGLPAEDSPGRLPEGASDDPQLGCRC